MLVLELASVPPPGRAEPSSHGRIGMMQVILKMRTAITECPHQLAERSLSVQAWQFERPRTVGAVGSIEFGLPMSRSDRRLPCDGAFLGEASGHFSIPL